MAPGRDSVSMMNFKLLLTHLAYLQLWVLEVWGGAPMGADAAVLGSELEFRFSCLLGPPGDVAFLGVAEGMTREGFYCTV